ncbi:ABC transporter ATP-binding protein [Paenalcaligenes niemegkensis]|uniref:ABC transporter ATP-binding protein n=1 Tax=Paenalcaligenes niemegkensis TaxID=2895469 RepID=UPI001EE7C1D0|nr:ABC transporter ATP-binding protein [Paenalcaligenes niemegkensis]MCQ9617224.1 ABC transporter ATP-binding protein [Paenalcaligenes niemegkensis]
MLNISRLYAGYDASSVLFDVDLELQTGQVLSLLGRNGMGKSTLIRCVLGLISPRQGSIYIDGVCTNGWQPDRIARAGVSIVPEGRQCFPNLTVHEHLSAFSANRNPASTQLWNAERVYHMFPRLAERKNNLGNQLSGGEQQMLAIGRALVTNPKLLILDEATEGLAPKIRDEIWACLSRLKHEGQTVLVVDKYVNRLMQIADHHVVIEKGRCVWEGDSDALSKASAVWERYLGI